MAGLSDIEIRSWIKNDVRFESKADGNGLSLCYRKELKTPIWRFRYRFVGKQRIVNLGNYKQVSLAEARKKAKELMARVISGFDVANEKQERKAKALDKINVSNFASLADLYYEKKIVGTWKNDRAIKARIDKYIKPHLGSLSIDDVKPTHIDSMIQAVVALNVPSVANDVLRWTVRRWLYIKPPVS